MKIRKKSIFAIVVSLTAIQVLTSFSIISEKENIESEGTIQHGVIYYKEGGFAAWPANNGIWSWGDEILVGFVTAPHKDIKNGHTYDKDFAKNKYARSMDGGQTALAHNNIVDAGSAVKPIPLKEGIPDFTDPNFIITFQRQSNDNGPSHFYYSNNKGIKWIGPYDFPDLGTDGVATRTDYVIDGIQELSAFLTVVKSNKKEGRVLLSRTKDGGVNWEIVSWIGSEPEKFDIMSSSVRLSPIEFLTVIRTRTGNGQDLLTSHLSKDNGKTWVKLKDPVADTGHSGSPPALVKLQDGRLALGYVYRSDYGSRVNVRFSSDNGISWGDEIVLRSGDGANRDVGYPRMVQRNDGKLVLIYYWNNSLKEGAKPYRYIASTIFDPNQWK